MSSLDDKTMTFNCIDFRRDKLADPRRLTEAAVCFEQALTHGADESLHRFYLASVRGDGAAPVAAICSRRGQGHRGRALHRAQLRVYGALLCAELGLDFTVSPGKQDFRGAHEHYRLQGQERFMIFGVLIDAPLAAEPGELGAVALANEIAHVRGDRHLEHV